MKTSFSIFLDLSIAHVMSCHKAQLLPPLGSHLKPFPLSLLLLLSSSLCRSIQPVQKYLQLEFSLSSHLINTINAAMQSGNRLRYHWGDQTTPGVSEIQDALFVKLGQAGHPRCPRSLDYKSIFVQKRANWCRLQSWTTHDFEKPGWVSPERD